MASTLQFLINAAGEKTAVVLPLEQYEELVKNSHAAAGMPSDKATSDMAPAGSVEELDEAYRQMAADEEREREANAWSEGLIGDVADEPR